MCIEFIPSRMHAGGFACGSFARGGFAHGGFARCGVYAFSHTRVLTCTHARRTCALSRSHMLMLTHACTCMFPPARAHTHAGTGALAGTRAFPLSLVRSRSLSPSLSLSLSLSLSPPLLSSPLSHSPLHTAPRISLYSPPTWPSAHTHAHGGSVEQRQGAGAGIRS